MSKVIIIGAGASGMIAAIRASYNNEVILLERNDKSGKKILLTGNGKCNYWNGNLDISKYNTDSEINLSKILEYKNDTLNFLYNLGIFPKIKGDYYYPYSSQATSIKEILGREISKRNIDLISNFKVTKIEKAGNSFCVYSENECIKAEKVIIATGSKAYPKTGSDGIGYDIASAFGHTINPVLPSLTQLHTTGSFLKDWENIRCDATVSLYIDGKLKKEDSGEIQLTSNGISGICVFNISGLASKFLALGKKVEVSIDFMPSLDNLYSWLEERNNIIDGTIEEILESIFNYKLMFVLLKKAKIDKNAYWSKLSKDDKNRLVMQIKKFKIDITDTDTIEKSQVCTGGVSLSEIDAKTMESLIVPNLYFCGEILDVDGECGGFNLAFAWISGYIAGGNV